MDPYALCPCGSKKKIKFCCHALYGEMEKVTRLQENNQPRMALQQLEKLDKEHPENPWVITRQAILLLSENRAEDAEASLRAFLRKHQDHSFANVLYGIASYGAAGYPGAKRAIHRAFRFGSADSQEFVASLASDIGLDAAMRGDYLSAREHLALAMKWGDEEHRKSIFSAIYDLDGTQSVPFALRGPQPLPAWSPPDELKEAVTRAQQLASIGCWHEAAEHLAAAAPEAEQPAELQHTIGLYRAWDGAESEAATALHRAAAAYADFETAVECETLAQLLDRRAPDRRKQFRTHQFEISAVSRLLTQLDASPRLSRASLTPDEVESTSGALTARYVVLDRDRLADGAPLELETVPRSVGAIAVFTGQQDDGPAGLAVVSAHEGPLSDAALEIFQDAAGDAVSADPETNLVPEAAAADETAEGFAPLYFSEGARNPDVTSVLLAEWNDVVHKRWSATSLDALGGKSPQEAAGIPELRVPLAAAINLLDAACARRGTILPVAELRATYQLPEIERIHADDNLNVSMLSFAQSSRIDLSSLNPQQLEQISQRALLMRHPAVAHEVLSHAIAQLDAAEHAGQRQLFFLVLSQICDDSFRTDESLQWIERGQAELPEGPERFERLARWKMRELTTRSNAEPGPELNAVLVELWQTFAPKLPGLQEMLTQTVATLGIDPPWDSAIITASDVPAATPEGWSPVATASAETGEKKLWLPGDR